MDTRPTKLCTLCNTLIFMLGVVMGKVFTHEHSTFSTMLVIGISTLAFYLVQINPIKFLYKKNK